MGKSIKIFARKCKVFEIDIDSCRRFLKVNHIQGDYKNINKSIGIFYNNELISVMTFDQFEGRKKMSENEWNLSRFCNKINHTVIGGASKLLDFFIKNYSPISTFAPFAFASSICDCTFATAFASMSGP